MGNELFKKVAGATGLPQELITKELSEMLTTKGVATEDVTMDDLRSALADYLREVILHAKDKFENGVIIEEEIHPDELGREDV